jgi:formylglycine-generating enzyme required for sulfatase activity
MNYLFRISIFLFCFLFSAELYAQSQCNQYSGRRREDCLRAARASGGNSGTSGTNNTAAANAARQREAARAREERQRRIAAAREEARQAEIRQARRVAESREAARREAARREAARAARATASARADSIAQAACTDKASITELFVPMEVKVGTETCFDVVGNGFATWRIGDNNEEKYGKTICHTFPQTGAYIVKAILDTECDTQEMTKTIAVSLNGPATATTPETAEFVDICTDTSAPTIASINVPTILDIGATHTFTATTNTANLPAIYTWTIGKDNFSGESTTQTFTQEGTYTVSLTLETECGTANSATSTFTVRNNNPVALLGVKFATVATGTFTMGDNLYEDAPPHRVKITQAYEIGTHEVTQKQWQSVMGNNPSKNNKCGENCPVENVSFADVQEFISKLNDLDPTHLYRLPTEAEWEFAARAGNNATWYFGNAADQICAYANFGQRIDFESKGNALSNVNCAASPNRSVSVGNLSANRLGLYDVYGNVAEWTQDCYHEFFYLQNTVDENPVNFNCSGAQAVRSIRGGSFNKGATSSKRFYAPSDAKDGNIGFRVVRVRAE